MSEDKARRDLPRLRQNLRELIELSTTAFPANIGRRSHVRFMLAAFAIKQNQHAASILRLGSSLDTMLIARSMLEGLSQLLWSLKRPRQRPLRWRAFAFVLDWRLLQDHRAEGLPIDPGVERNIRAGLRRHGKAFLSKEARAARSARKPLPADPYVKNWYAEREMGILRDVGGHMLADVAYRFFSEWHHWRPRAISQFIAFDARSGVFEMNASIPNAVAMAMACGFQCLWQTMSLMNKRCYLGIGRQLRCLYRRQLAIGS